MGRKKHKTEIEIALSLAKLKADGYQRETNRLDYLVDNLTKELNIVKKEKILLETDNKSLKIELEQRKKLGDLNESKI